MATARTPIGKRNNDGESEIGSDEESGARALQPAVPSITKQLKQQKLNKMERKIEEELRVLLLKKDTVERKLMRIQTALELPDSAANKHLLQLQLKMLESSYVEYNDLQNEIYGLNVSEKVKGEEETKFINFESLYSELFVRITERIEHNMKSESVQCETHPVAVQQYAPALKAPLPTFDGSYENWFAFKSMFENVMGRYQAESPAIKLYHLRNALVGAAAGVIDQDIINNNDYDAAWETLRERFEDKRVIVDRHIEAIFNIPSMIKESAVGLRKIIDICTKNIDALKNLELPVNGLSEVILLNVLTKKLDAETRKAWELEQKNNELPDYQSTMNFLKERCRVYEKLSRTSKLASDVVKTVRQTVKSETKMHSLVAVSEKCTHCKNDHEIWKCEAFKKASLNEKYNSLRKSGSCFNCLERGHVTGKCRSQSSCKRCGKRHHTYLHNDEQQSVVVSVTKEDAKVEDQTQATTEEPTNVIASNPSSVLYSNADTDQDTLLATAIVFVCGAGNNSVSCRAVLDSASHKHFITEDVVSKLGLKRKQANFTIVGIGGIQMVIRSKVYAKIKSKVSDYESPMLELLVVKRITGDLPMSSFSTAEIKIPNGVQLADPQFNVPGQVDILVGSGLFFKLIKHGQLHSADHLPAIQETHLGWIISGIIPTNEVGVSDALCAVATEEDIGKLLERFWHIDSFDEKEPLKYDGGSTCVAHFLETHRRDVNGRFIVRLPFNERKVYLGESRLMAERRFSAVERRLERDPTIKSQYVAFMKEYEDLGHMSEVVPSADEIPGEAFFLPHHCVLKPSSTTTKLRVVFDGSAESTSGISINDTQMIGPTVQNDLISILLRFRSFRIAISADIPKMYRQIAVHEEDTCYQRIVWRASRDQPLKVYALKTVTYGLSSSPFLATMALKQLADNEGHRFPLAQKVIYKSCYIDDLLFGADTPKESKEVLEQVVGLLHGGCFDVHKLYSNSKMVLEGIPEHQRERVDADDDLVINSLMKTLGISWDAESDNFAIRIPESRTNEKLPVTKRIILIEISRIFDPLGLIGPVVTAAKLIMRELWALDLKWDDSVPESFTVLWFDFCTRLQELNGVQIPRLILAAKPAVVELHGFADASDLAYGACLYVRSILSDGTAEMKLVCSKSRILPKKIENQKQITTPRAELEAALLLSRLTTKITTALEMSFSSIVLWSDSTIVLSWLEKPLDTLLVYVRNRVSEIRALTDSYRWRYIPSKSNPADVISRGIQPNLLRGHDVWWNGPQILRKDVYEIPQPHTIANEVLPEMRKISMLCTVPRERMKIFDSVSRFSILQRAMAYVVRFGDYIKSGRKQLTKGLPTADEMRRALLLIVRLIQKECFALIFQQIEEENEFKHPLNCLHPFIDPNDGTLRVGGRIRNASIPFDSKHQLLLPHDHPVTISLIRYLHKSNMHIGQRGLLAIVRQQFWPMRAKNVIRNIIHKCVQCYRLRPKRATQLMGDLPECRVQGTFAFATVGIDFAGPFTLKASTSVRKALSTKGYVCVFVCMATHALHLEAVSGLSTDGFIAALQRFVSRRGLPQKILSDNATNFVGANNELGRLAELFRSDPHQKKLNEFCAQRQIDWSFIPPRSPHFGGMWEAGVKSVKTHLRPILAEHNLSYEEFYTVLTQIEATLNSRPLTPSSNDPTDMTAITPAHFLIGKEFQAINEPLYSQVKVGRLSRWQIVQDLRQKFWRVWSTDYLQELQRRQRDFKVTHFKLGTLVLVVDDNLPPLKWIKGRITQLHPGRDGNVRVVTLATKDSTIKRAVKNICLLPLDGDDDF